MLASPYSQEWEGGHPRGRKIIYSCEKIVAIAAASLALYLALTESLDWLPFFVGAVAACIMLFVSWPYGALLELFIAASIPRWVVPIHSWKAKPEHFIAAAVGSVMLLRMIGYKHKWKSWSKVEFLVFAFLAMNFFTSIAVSPDRASSLRWALLLTLAMSPFFLLWQVVHTEKQLHRLMVLWLSVGAVEATFGIFCFLSHLAFRTNFGVTIVDFLGFMPEVHGSLWEPNIFGSYCTCFAVMFLFYFLDCSPKNSWYLAGFFVTTVGALLSLARQSWICLIAIGGLVLVYNLRTNNIRIKHLAPIVAGVLLAIVVGANAVQELSERVASFTGEAAEDPTVVRRVQMVALATSDILGHPIIGQGTGSLGILYIADSDTTYEGVDRAWLGSLFVGIVHDTGLVGMAIFVCFAIALGRRAWRVIAGSVRSASRTAVGALFAGLLVLLIAYQFTDASTFAFTWIEFGLMASGLRIAESYSLRLTTSQGS
jgi:O-Antigen ligase